MIVFAFVFGAYQIPEILGVRYPRTLPVLSLRFFLDADLNARAEAMAMSIIITAIVMAIVAGYRWVSGRGAYRNG
jgi:putative spermidine/putrescine transport system permease protein